MCRLRAHTTTTPQKSPQNLKLLDVSIIKINWIFFLCETSRIEQGSDTFVYSNTNKVFCRISCKKVFNIKKKERRKDEKLGFNRVAQINNVSIEKTTWIYFPWHLPDNLFFRLGDGSWERLEIIDWSETKGKEKRKLFSVEVKLFLFSVIKRRKSLEKTKTYRIQLTRAQCDNWKCKRLPSANSQEKKQGKAAKLI